MTSAVVESFNVCFEKKVVVGANGVDVLMLVGREWGSDVTQGLLAWLR